MRKLFCLLLLSVAALVPQTFPSPNTTPPSVTSKVEPEYTEEARQANYSGTVQLQTMISAEGVPTEIRVIRGLGMGLDEKAVECLEQWRFKPATRDGQPISVRATVEITFRLPQR